MIPTSRVAPTLVLFTPPYAQSTTTIVRSSPAGTKPNIRLTASARSMVRTSAGLNDCMASLRAALGWRPRQRRYNVIANLEPGTLAPWNRSRGGTLEMHHESLDFLDFKPPARSWTRLASRYSMRPCHAYVLDF